MWREVTSLDGKIFYVNKFTGKMSLQKFYKEKETLGGILGKNFLGKFWE